MSELDAYFDRLRVGAFGASDPNVVPQQVIAVGDGNVQPTGWYGQHEFSSSIGSTNVLLDPALEGWDSAGVSVGPSATALNSAWNGHYVLNSGTPPVGLQFYGQYYARGRSPFNSDQIAFQAFAFGANACNLDVYLYPSLDYSPGSIGANVLPWLVAALRYSHHDTTLGDAAIRLYLQIVNTTDSIVVAESAALDPSTLAHGEIRPLVAATTQTSAVFGAKAWQWRLRINIVKPATATTSITLTFGEPSLHFNYVPEPLPFAPLIGGWQPRLLLSERGATSEIINARAARDPNPRLTADASGKFSWGSGVAGTDTALYRSAAGVLTIATPAGNPAALAIIGKRIATPQASQTVVAGTAISVTSEVVQISATGAVTMTAAPTIADGTDGQMLTLLNVGSFNITVQDQGTLAGSNLRLTAATVTLAPRQSIKLMYSATVGDWVQVGPLVAVL